NLGIVRFDIKDKRIISKTAELFTKKAAESTEEDIDVLNAIADIEKINKSITGEVVATSDIKLNGEREFVRTGQTNLGNLITKAMIEETNADFAITNGGGIRASIDPGKVTLGDIITVLPFGNYVVKQEITGKEILGILENSLSNYPKQAGSFPHIAGMELKFDSSQEAGNRVTQVFINGKLIDENKTYTFATNDFLAAGGDNYPKGLKILTEYGGLDEILIEWMKENGTKGAEVDDRIIDISDGITFLILDKFIA
ncbi:MAG: bifunctional metallophosphatase/5'-nucleotidase, partial [Pseudomonadota bacterium]